MAARTTIEPMSFDDIHQERYFEEVRRILNSHLSDATLHLPDIIPITATKVISSSTETLSVLDSNYIDIDTSGNTLTLSNMVDGSQMEIHNSSTGDAILSFDIKVGTTNFTAPVTMPSGDSYQLTYDLASETWVL